MITKNFLREFKRLNEKQREAVEAIEGPVMVVAGPGTGKTQIIAMRIANILKETQVEPQNILALTFTNSGVWAMKKRLLEIIGPASYRVHVHTFHSFCNEIIQTFPEKFLFSDRLNQISDLEQILVVKQILDASNFSLIKKPKSPYYYQAVILDSIRQLKQENIAPEYYKKQVLAEICQIENLPDLLNEKGPYKDKIKSKYADRIQDLQKNLEVASAYRQYTQALAKSGQYDYADMIMLVVKQFKKDRDLLGFYQEKYQYILVDEYQDTNSAQNEVVRLLASFYDSPNLFVVGDDEQSIFRFQGAALENILFFLKAYPKTKVIVLDKNYRSGQLILDASRASIQNNQKQIFSLLKIEKKLQSETGIKALIQTATFSSGAVEDYFIAKTIKKLLKKTEPPEMAVIYREHRDVNNLAELLAKERIPFVRANSENVLEDLEIKKIINLLSVINNPYQDALMFEVMHYDFLQIDILDIYRLANLSSVERQPIFTLLTEKSPQTAKKPLKLLVELLLRSSANFMNFTFAHAFELLIEESGFLRKLLKSADAPIRLNNLKSLFDEIKELNLRRNNLKLNDFLIFLNNLSENNLPIKAEQLETDFRGVRLLTAHQAKGLEFKTVFIMHLTDNHWGNKKTKNLIKFPTNLLENTPVDFEPDEEERRLFYVALTRAKANLYLTYAIQYEKQQENIPSKFLLEIPKKFTHKINSKNFEQKPEKRLLLELKPMERNLTKEMTAFLKQIAERFLLSSTSLNAYLACPLEFFYNQFLRVPRVKNYSLCYGSAVHYALEQFFRKQIRDGVLPQKKWLLKFFQKGLKREILTLEEKKRAELDGRKTLSLYFDFYKIDLAKRFPLAVEFKFGSHRVHFGEIPITGNLDKFELLDKNANTIKIIDYKTAEPKSLNYLLGKTKEEDKSYLYQAFFYKLLCENDPSFNWKVSEVEFEFLTPQKGIFKKVSLPIDREEYAKFLELIKTTYKNIMDLQFDKNIEQCDQRRFECAFSPLCRKN